MKTAFWKVWIDNWIIHQEEIINDEWIGINPFIRIRRYICPDWPTVWKLVEISSDDKIIWNK